MPFKKFIYCFCLIILSSVLLSFYIYVTSLSYHYLELNALLLVLWMKTNTDSFQ